MANEETINEYDILQALEKAKSDVSEINDNFKELDDSDADPDYTPHLVQEENFAESIFDIESWRKTKH